MWKAGAEQIPKLTVRVRSKPHGNQWIERSYDHWDSPSSITRLAQFAQVDGEVVRRGQGVGVVLAEHPAAAV
jgi:hypothetical protein